MIVGTTPDGPADRAGLSAGDLITHVSGRRVRSAQHFVRMSGEQPVGTTIRIDFVRHGEDRRADLIVDRRPAKSSEDRSEATFTFRGAVVGTLDPVACVRANVPMHALLVIGVSEDTTAARAGLMPGVIIVRADGQTLDGGSGRRLAGVADKDVLLGLASGGSALVKSR